MQAIDNTNLLNICRDCGAEGFIPEVDYEFDFSAKTVTVNNTSTIPATDNLRKIKIKVHDMFGGQVTAFMSDGGEGYTSAPSVAIGGDGTAAAATAVVTKGRVSSITVDNGGTGYTSAPITFSGGGGSGAAAVATIAAGIITAITVLAPDQVVIDVSSLNLAKPLALSVTISTDDGIMADGGAYGLMPAGDVSYWDVQKNASVAP